jgi:two-component SAPR family response regulator
MSCDRARVLIVEDEWLIAEQIDEELREAGFEVVGTAATVHQAMNVLNNQVIDFAVLDVNLLNERSYPVAEHLAEHSIPFVFLTGYIAGNLPQPFNSRPLLKKPLEEGELSKSIRAALDQGKT